MQSSVTPRQAEQQNLTQWRIAHAEREDAEYVQLEVSKNAAACNEQRVVVQRYAAEPDGWGARHEVTAAEAKVRE